MIDVNFDGVYLLHLDALFEEATVSHGLDYTFTENELGIHLRIFEPKTDITVYEHQCSFFQKRRSIECFLLRNPMKTK